jgi:cysteinyl-tRNA synthetase
VTSSCGGSALCDEIGRRNERRAAESRHEGDYTLGFVRLYSTLSRQVEELPPPPSPIRMYFCGPTVYARAHIGNARPFVLGMWLRSWLRFRGYDVTLVHNITDVNDKIYDAAPGASAELAERATQWYLEDTGDLGLGMPDALPKATEAIPEIVRFIEKLIETGHAYTAGGDVYFSVASDPGYGALSRQRVEDMDPEETNALKQAPQDFALWKATKPGEDTSWESPWGAGRPGWHIECSVMAEEAFGPVFEIHGGGIDLRFPHHENELAQSRALGHDFARIWTHNGMLTFGDEKMSKSLHNDVSIRNVLDTWGHEVVLLYFMTAHWRKPIDFNDDTLMQAKAQVERFRNVFRSPSEPVDDWDAFVDVLDDDFNTPEALAIMHGWRDHELLRRALAIFGLASLGDLAVAPPEIVKLAEARQRAREAGDFAEADRLRDEIAAAGWDVRDVPGGFELVPRT